jgi:sirohydrochlorin ferrochelatase
MTQALVIVDHGSRQPEAHRHLEWIAAQVRQRAPDLKVHVAHMDLAEPSIEAAVAACVREGVAEVVVHPLFLVPGRHLTEDIPALIRRCAERHPGVRVRLTDPLGSVPGLADLILRAVSSSA